MYEVHLSEVELGGGKPSFLLFWWYVDSLVEYPNLFGFAIVLGR